jgi:hypothetical protein
LQFILDIAGLIPVVGEPADGVNALIYLARKDYVNATSSGAALIPVAGILSTGGKITAKAVKAISKADDVLNGAKAVGKVVSSIEDIKEADDVLDFVRNDKLKNTVKEIFRVGGKIGNGSLADAIRHEIKTGQLVGGKSHIQKGIERIKNLENILITQQLTNKEIEFIQETIADILNALRGN